MWATSASRLVASGAAIADFGRSGAGPLEGTHGGWSSLYTRLLVRVRRVDGTAARSQARAARPGKPSSRRQGCPLVTTVQQAPVGGAVTQGGTAPSPNWIPWLIFFARLLITGVTVSSVAGPYSMGDELLYRLSADELWRGQVGEPHYTYSTPHYPPLYSLVLGVGLLAGESFYGAMLFINALVSSAVVFPTWWFARRWLHDARTRILVTVAVALLPFHVFFPRVLLSENLFFPLFLAALYAVAESRRSGRLEFAFVAGALLGACHLTRHISLVLVPAFAISLALPRGSYTKAAVLQGLRTAGAAGLAYTCTYLPWLLFAASQDVDLAQAAGLNISGEAAGGDGTPRDFVLWTLRYGSYVFFAIFPFAAPLVFAAQRPRLLDRRCRELVLLFAAASFLLVVAAARHSYLVYYNYPEPYGLLGRYVMYLSVPWLLVSAIVLERAAVKRYYARELAVAFGVTVVLAATAWSVLILPNRPGFVFHSNGPDSVMLLESELFWAGSAAMLMAAVALARWPRVAFRPIVRGFLPAVVLVYAVGSAVMVWKHVLVTDLNDRGVHAQQIAQVMSERPRRSEKVVVNLARPPQAPYHVVRDGIRFRGFDAASFEVVGIRGDPGLVRGDADDVVVTPRALEGREVLASYTYSLDGQRYYIYGAR